MSPGEPDLAVIRRHLLALDAAMQRLRRHAGRPLAALVAEPDTLGALPDAFARRFRGIAGFRNVLVHGYLAVDPGRIHELLNSGLDDFLAFAQHVERYLSRSKT